MWVDLPSYDIFLFNAFMPYFDVSGWDVTDNHLSVTALKARLAAMRTS